MAEPGAAHGEVLWYVVGVIRPAAGALDGVPTLLPNRPLELVGGDDLKAVACQVPASLLDDRAAEAVDHVGQLAVAHDRVLRALAERTAVVPARLGSLYPSRQSVAEMLQARGGALGAALEELAGRREWGVKVFRERAQPSSGSTDGEVQSGTAYLRRRQAERRRRTDEQDAAAALVAKLHRAVAAQAHAAVTRQLQHPKLSGVRAPMLLNAAYLVDAARQDAFGALVRDQAERHRPAGLRVELTGPWPPYSFTGSGERP